MSEYGGATLQAHYDLNGRVTEVTVLQADPVIGVSQELLDHAESWVFPGEGQDIIQLDTAGEYRYRRIGPAVDRFMVIYERIQP